MSLETNRQNPILLIVCLGGILRFVIAWAPFEWLLRYVLSDDAFYYFTIARNAAHGYGLTFDRLAATNGFHPLWLSILIPLQSIVSDRITAIHVILTLSAIIDTLSICLLWILLSRYDVRQGIRTLVCSFYAFSPILLSHAGPLSGLETALNLMLIITYLILYNDILNYRLSSIVGTLRFGFVSALVFLVRTDNSILLVITYAHLLFSFRQEAQHLLRLVGAGTLALILIAPWALWCYKEFGSIVQVSGLSVAFVSRTNVVLQGWGFTDYLWQVVRNMAGITIFFPFYLNDTRIISLVPILTSTAIGIMIAAVVWSYLSAVAIIQRDNKQRLRTFAPLALVTAAYIVVHTLRGVYLRGWYYTGLLPTLFLFFAILLDLVTARLKNVFTSMRSILGVVMVVLIVIDYGVAMQRVFAKEVGETDKYEMVNTLNSILPANTMIGSWNAGVYGYFFERGVVVNLDGLVNNVAFKYIKNRSLELYSRNAGIAYLVDPSSSLRFWKDYWRPEPVDMFHQGEIIFSMPARGNQDSIVVMKLVEHKRVLAK